MQTIEQSICQAEAENIFPLPRSGQIWPQVGLARRGEEKKNWQPASAKDAQDAKTKRRKGGISKKIWLPLAKDEKYEENC